jgi:hypothetical protein
MRKMGHITEQGYKDDDCVLLHPIQRQPRLIYFEYKTVCRIHACLTPRAACSGVMLSYGTYNTNKNVSWGLSSLLNFFFFFYLFVTLILFVKARGLGVSLGNTFAVTSSHNTIAKLNTSAFWSYGRWFMTLYQTNYSIRKSIRCKFKKNRAHDVAQKMKKFTRNMNLRKTYKTRVHFFCLKRGWKSGCISFNLMFSTAEEREYSNWKV